MQYYEFIASRGDTGAVLPLAKVTVFLAGTATLASIYDSAGAGLANPTTAAPSGLVGFAAANGAYDIQIASADGSYLAPKVHDLQLYDLSQLDAKVATVTAATTAPGFLAVAADLALGAASKIGTVAADLLSGASNIAVVAADLALGGASLIRQAISSAAAAASSAAAAAASAASIGWFFRGPSGFALIDTAGYRWLNVTLTDIKHVAIDLIKSRLAALEAYTAKLPLIGAPGAATFSLVDNNGYNWLKATPTTLQHKVIEAMSNRIVAALRGPPDPSIANMRIIAERIGLHMSGESLSLGHGSPVITVGASATSDMFGNAELTKASIVPDDIGDISSASDSDLISNRAALTPAVELSYSADADDWTSHGETPLTGCAQMIVQLLKDEDGIDFLAAGMRFLLSDDGRNGGSITTEDATLTGLTAQRVYASFGQAQALYSALGKSYAPAAQMIITGTNDNASDSTNYPSGADTKWFYTRAQTVQLQRQAKAIALRLISPNARLPLLIGQTATHTNPVFNAPIPHVALDQLQLAIDKPEFILACIQYGVQNGVNDIHMTGAGSKQMGAYFGWHLKRLMFDGLRIGPMVPTFTAQNSQIVATFPVRPGHTIAGGLTVADTTVLSNWGVAAVDANGIAKTLSNPRAVARDRIVWDAPAAPANTWKFRCGYTGNTTKAWTNIAETRADSTLIFDPYALRLPMYRWLPICEVPLT
ncbi:hypothetical protein [Sphingomonas sp.]|uniref:hypothetical protein n=1 Tax=Sphingomonas sp. TaxID=28214 RepID=UPI002600EB8B|nr:hypothetical protein [Sphingomonas sp.]